MYTSERTERVVDLMGDTEQNTIDVDYVLVSEDEDSDDEEDKVNLSEVVR